MTNDFIPFRKIPRLSREIVITEKIDGTNAQICIPAANAEPVTDGFPVYIDHATGAMLYAGSRNRWLSREADNFGFAKWCADNCGELMKLGPGRHYGEWWGLGIQRGYGLNERRFSLFHAHGIAAKPDCVSVVPVLYQGDFDTHWIDRAIESLERDGSYAAPGFMDPEGIVIYHSAANVLFKKTLKDDKKPKGAAA